MIWAALLAAQLVYAAVGLSGLVRPAPELPQRAAPLAPLLGAIALATSVAAHVLWRRAAASTPGEAHGRAIAAWVLDESVGILGLVLALLGWPARSWLPFFAFALVLLLVHRPTRWNA